MHNDPYAGNGNHLNDVAMYAPVFWEGQLTGFVSVKAHWSDVGGPVPSSMQIGSREFRQEGLRFQSVRLFDRGELNEEVMRMIRGQHPHRERHAEGYSGHDRGVQGGGGLLPRDPGQVRA